MQREKRARETKHEAKKHTRMLCENLKYSGGESESNRKKIYVAKTIGPIDGTIKN